MNTNEMHPNAQKWTEENVTEHLLFIAKDAESGTSLFLGRALAKRGLYRHVWSYWKKAFAGNADMMEMFLNIESLFEAKILEGALRKELSSTMAAITLRYNYNWKDKPMGITPNSLLERNFRQ